MTGTRPAEIIRHLKPSDAELLARYVRRDEEAFAALVRRHGPLVLGVCRRIASHAQDAEDAFQAVFLILATKAATGCMASRCGWRGRPVAARPGDAPGRCRP